MNAHEKEQLVAEVVDQIIKRSNKKIKIKTKTVKIKRKFASRSAAKNYELELRESYTAQLLAELNRLLEEE
ncbi:hypothetical protein BAU15_10225 [Enterococcus sp. JM4C]|uniref:hypothetical protein n=1 Tax=Candidatus Enterococcus huntleyi TaxID=1857217 RepID=UPI00137A91A6|nr:hypothetical protein [Enterococcus sp. JM4C]KAF1296156.1 hypothetical protein BAU15_10225 [Enterococcus sp. JM4C]